MHQPQDHVIILKSVCTFLNAPDLVNYKIATTERRENKQNKKRKTYKNKYLLNTLDENKIRKSDDDFYRYKRVQSMIHFRKEIGRTAANLYSEVNSLDFDSEPNWSECQRVQYFHQKEIFRIKVLKAAEEMTEGLLASKLLAKYSCCR